MGENRRCQSRQPATKALAVQAPYHPSRRQSRQPATKALAVQTPYRPSRRQRRPPAMRALAVQAQYRPSHPQRRPVATRALAVQAQYRPSRRQRRLIEVRADQFTRSRRRNHRTAIAIPTDRGTGSGFQKGCTIGFSNHFALPDYSQARGGWDG